MYCLVWYWQVFGSHGNFANLRHVLENNEHVKDTNILSFQSMRGTKLWYTISKWVCICIF
jgi:hypothetical protein